MTEMQHLLNHLFGGRFPVQILLREVPKSRAKKLISAIAYTIVGSEVVKDNLTVENARRVASVSKRIAVRAGTTIRGSISKGKVAVQKRREEIKKAKSDKDSLI